MVAQYSTTYLSVKLQTRSAYLGCEGKVHVQKTMPLKENKPKYLAVIQPKTNPGKFACDTESVTAFVVQRYQQPLR